MRTDNPALAHFMDLATQGKHSGCSTGEGAARDLALVFLDKGLSLDDAAIDGFIDFMRAAKCSPQTARISIGADRPDQSLPDRHSAEHMQTLDSMERTGGGFVACLAAAWRRADPLNHAKLFDAFAGYYREYQSKGEESRA